MNSPRSHRASHTVIISMSQLSFPVNLRPDSKNWLTSVTDPFHDFEHPIEGAPDHVIGKSFTRLFTQTISVGATADDDNLVIQFFGSHGAESMSFSSWGPDGFCDTPGSDVPIAPISVFRAASGVNPSLTSYAAGVTSLIASLYTAQSDLIPSRLVSLGIEVVDTSPALYRKGTLHANHMTGVVEDITLCRPDATAVTPLGSFQLAYRKPPVPSSPTALVTLPGSYTNALSKGVYLVARLNEIQGPGRGSAMMPNGNVYGSHQAVPVLAEPYPANPERDAYFAPMIAGSTNTWDQLSTMKTWRDSGFSPFTIMLRSISSESTFQITVKSTVEYFPHVTQLLECGMATYSPVFEPEAFQIYHEVMRRIPAGVPVSMNAAGDYWRLLLAALRKVMEVGRRVAPIAGVALQAVGNSTGNPALSAVGQALSLVPQTRRVQRRVGKKK